MHYGVHLSVNGDVTNDSVFNNTFIRNSDSKVWSHYIRPGTGWYYHSVYSYNHLATNTIKGTDVQNNKIGIISSLGIVGAEYSDMRLLPGSPAIDFGREMNAITNAVGDAPDAGAYEFGDTCTTANWIAGIDWTPEWNKKPTANFSVETEGGEVRLSVEDDSDEDGWIMRYDWDFGDGNTFYGKMVIHNYAESGEYNITLTIRDNLAEVVRLSKNVSAVIPTNIVEDNSIDRLVIFPNPVKDMLHFSEPIKFDCLKVFDLHGRCILSRLNGENMLDLNVERLPGGIYILEVMNANSNNIQQFVKF